MVLPFQGTQQRTSFSVPNFTFVALVESKDETESGLLSEDMEGDPGSSLPDYTNLASLLTFYQIHHLTLLFSQY